MKLYYHTEHLFVNNIWNNYGKPTFANLIFANFTKMYFRQISRIDVSLLVRMCHGDPDYFTSTVYHCKFKDFVQ